MDLAKRIAENRMNCNLSQSDLAARLFVSRDLVSKWETGARRPDWQMIGKIADALHIPVSDLVDKNELVYRELEMCLPKESSLSVEELIPLLNLFLEGLLAVFSNSIIKDCYRKMIKKIILQINSIRFFCHDKSHLTCISL